MDRPTPVERRVRACAPVAGALAAEPGDAAATASDGEPASGLTGNDTLAKDDEDFDQHVNMEEDDSPTHSKGARKTQRRASNAGAAKRAGPSRTGV